MFVLDNNNNNNNNNNMKKINHEVNYIVDLFMIITRSNKSRSQIRSDPIRIISNIWRKLK